MTTLMTQRQLDALRSVGDCMFVLVVMFVIDKNHPGRTTTSRELLPAVYPVIKDIRKLEPQLNALCASGRLTRTGAGYVLIEGGKALVLELFGNGFVGEGFEIGRKDLALSPAQDAGTVVPPLNGELAQALEIIESAPLSAIRPTFSQTNKRGSGEENLTRKMRALEVVEEGTSPIKILEIDSSTSTPQNAQNAQTEATGKEFPSVKQILAASSILFDGREVITKDLQLDLIDPFEALAIMAHSYAGRKTPENPRGFYSPAGIAHTMLKDGKGARAEFRFTPLDHLPDAYLEILGLIEYSCQECSEVFKTRAESLNHEGMKFVCGYECGARFHSEDNLHSHYKSNHAQAEEIQTYEALPSDSRGAKGWELVRNELATEMPKASFETWVRDTEAIALEEKRLSVAVRNAYARDWLESRLAAKVNAMLKTYLHEDVTVNFVVGKIDKEEELL